MVTNYKQAVEYLYSNLPMFQRVGAVALKNDLSNTIKLCEALGNPQTKFKSIHVAGTNGKGSTSHLLASILQSAGYKTGLYTSPHLKDFAERIKVNGQQVTEEFIVDFVNRLQPEMERIKPSFFEITVVMAFDYFVQQKVDVAVVEVGLGGRLDSTNVITPVLSVITNIGWDHMDILGDTLQKIAMEKAGIIKPGIPLVVSERQPEIENVFRATALETNSEIYIASDSLMAEHHDGSMDILHGDKKFYLKDLKLPLQGSYQRKNVVGVLKSVEVLTSLGFEIRKDVLRHGLEHVIEQTGLKGRWQRLSEKPLTICDTAHNVDGVREVVQQIRLQQYNKLHIVLGMVRDKDITNVLKLLPTEATYYFCQAKIPRAMDANVLAEKASGLGLQGIVVDDVNKAIGEAKRNASTNDFIFIGGSTFVVAEINGL